MPARSAKSPPRTKPGNDEFDVQHSIGMHGEGEDWSQLPNSQRKDRPLSREQLKELTSKSDLMGALQLIGNFMLCGATGSGILASWEALPTHWMQVWPMVLLAGLSIWQGFLLSALGFAAQHECLHYTAFRTRWLNGFVGRLVSIPSYAFYLQEKAMHKEHHTFTQDLHRDPELIAEVAGCTYAGGASGLPEGVDLAAVAAAGRNGFKKVPMDRAQYIERFTNLYGYLEGKLKKFYCARQPVSRDPASPSPLASPPAPALLLTQRWSPYRCRPPQTAPRASQWTTRPTAGCSRTALRARS